MEFHRGANAVISQPCRECKSSAKQAATRLRHVAKGREPYHLLSEVDPEARTATCRECGPTHIYATGASKGKGWRCGKRGDRISEEWYSAKAAIVDKHVSARWHRIRDVRGDEMRGTCSQCGDVPVRWNQTSGYFTCSGPIRRARHAEQWRLANRLKKYGLTPEQYDQMLKEQGGRCAICGVETNQRADSDGSLVPDHCHVSGVVRGLLCSMCNTGLGMFRDSPVLLLSAAAYLEKTATRK